MGGFPQYFNTGIMLWSAKQAGVFEAFSPDNVRALVNGKTAFFEQDLINYLIVRDQVKVRDLGLSFNYMDMNWGFGRLRADFIHYAGSGFSRNMTTRDQVIRDDFHMHYGEQFGLPYEENPEFYERRHWLYRMRFPIPVPQLRYI